MQCYLDATRQIIQRKMEILRINEHVGTIDI